MTALGGAPPEVQDCLEALEMLEVFAAEKVARMGSDEQLDRLRGELGEASRQDPTGRDHQFRRLMVELSGNTLARLTAEPMLAMIRDVSTYSHLSEGDVQARHRAIVAAIEARDPDLAGRTMRAHVRAVHGW